MLIQFLKKTIFPADKRRRRRDADDDNDDDDDDDDDDGNLISLLTSYLSFE